MDEAVVALDPQGVVRAANGVAARTLPELVVGQVPTGGGPVAEALREGGASFEVDRGERRLAGRRVALDGVTVWYVRDITEQTMRTDALLAERWRSAFLAESGRRLAASLHRDRTARLAARLAVPSLGDAAVVILHEPRSRLAWCRYSGENGEHVAGAVTVEELAAVPALPDVLNGLTIEDDPRLPAELETLSWLRPAGFGEIGSVLALPLPGHGVAVGALLVIRHAGRAGFEPAERHLVRQYAARAGAAIAAATLYREQVQTAEVLQESLRPPELPAVPGVVLGAAYRPAKERLRIGGDFYQVTTATDGVSTFALGDVCGKGVEAAVQTGEVRQMLTALWRTETDPARLLSLLNDVLLSTGRSRLTTMVLGTLTPAPGGGLNVALAVAGHPPPLVLRAGGSVETLEVRGMVLGAFAPGRFGGAELRLEPGDTLVLYSDGVTEARGGPGGADFFGRERLIARLDGYGSAPAPATAERIELSATEWLGGREHDDIAVLTIQAQPRRSGARGAARARHLRSVAGS